MGIPSASACPFHGQDDRAAFYYHYYGSLPPGFEEQADRIGDEGRATPQPRVLPSFAKRNYFTLRQYRRTNSELWKAPAGGDVQQAPLVSEADLDKRID